MRTYEAGSWVGTWGAAPQPALGGPKRYENQTLRLVMRASVGGTAVRVRICNLYGKTPLVIGGAHIALRDSGARILQGTERILTFKSQRSATVPTASTIESDPVDLTVGALSDLALSLYLPRHTQVDTDHFFAMQTSYVSQVTGDFCGVVELPRAEEITSWPLVTGIDVLTMSTPRTLVALGDSIVDGAASSEDTYQRWLDHLASRFAFDDRTSSIGVVNMGIIGNRIVHPSPPGREFHGPAGTDRFQRDVLEQTAVRYAVLLFGVNDLGFAGAVTPESEEVSADDLTSAFHKLVEAAHGAGVRVMLSTITPFENATSGPGFHTAKKEAVRNDVNRWIRSSRDIDGVLDFDRALRDPERPSQLWKRFDSGDHLHPNDAGHRAMADAIDLGLFHEA